MSPAFIPATVIVVAGACIACAALTLAAPSVAGKPDQLYVNANVYTQDESRPHAEAFIVRDGRYAYVGNEADAREQLRAEHTEIDLRGQFVMPALIDAHLHPVRGGTSNLYECQFPFSADPAGVREAVSHCIAENPDATWIRGGQWDSGFFERFDIASPRRFLDAVSGDAAVVLSDDSHHNGWANSRALELAGVTAETPDPQGGRFGREAGSREPNGLLYEAAKYKVFSQLPEWTPEQLVAGAGEAVRVAKEFGVVGLKDANATEEVLAAYAALVNAGEASAYLAATISTPRGRDHSPLDYRRLEDLRTRFHGNGLDVRYVKLYLDGVPTASRTAAMLDDYLPEAAGSDTHGGELLIYPETLYRDLRELDRRGFTVKIHTAGDRAVRVALDAIARVREENGDSGLHHELAHAGYIDPDDIGRFWELGAVADLSPYLWYPSAIMQSIVGALGERGTRYWPVRDLVGAGAPLLAGSDWPAGVPSMNPWEGIEAMVTRRHPLDAFPGALWPTQGISLAETLRIFTLSGARALGLEGRTGAIRTGYSADFIVLEKSLFDIPIEAISDTQVQATVFRGEVVHEL